MTNMMAPWDRIQVVVAGKRPTKGTHDVLVGASLPHRYIRGRIKLRLFGRKHKIKVCQDLFVVSKIYRWYLA